MIFPMALQIKELVCWFCGKMTQITDSVERMFVGGFLLSLLRACHANGKFKFFTLFSSVLVSLLAVISLMNIATEIILPYELLAVI